MQDFLSFITAMLQAMSAFLLTEPMIWFVGIFMLAAIVAVVLKIIRIGRS